MQVAEAVKKEKYHHSSDCQTMKKLRKVDDDEDSKAKLSLTVIKYFHYDIIFH